jgi:Leucine-rich repeat (LRR) protein
VFTNSKAISHYRGCLFLAVFFAALVLPLRAAPPAQASAPAAPNQATSSDPSLVGYWPFELGSADADLSGSGNTVTFGNGMGLTSAAAPTPFANQTALLSWLSPTSYATAPGKNIDNLQQFTIAFWLRMNSLPSNGQIMTLVNLTNKARIEYAPVGTQHDFFFYIQGSSSGRGIYFRDIQPNVYYHIVATYDANGMSVYVNGQLKNNLPGFVAPVQGAGVAFSSPTTPLDGNLDDVRIYNRGFSQGEAASMSYSCANVSQIPQAECQALFDLYTSAGGPQWTHQNNWLLNNTPCVWDRVLCNNGHIILLDMTNNGLSGTLPPSLNNLTGLISLGLSGNNLSGPIPPLLSGLTQLQALDVSNNHLSGELPALLGNLISLRTLNLSANALSGDISPLITKLTQLTTLNISYNALNPTDSAVRTFLSTYQPDWAATQTVPPTNSQAQIMSSTSVALTWTPIAYAADGGYYEVLASPGTGLYSSVGKTADKTAKGITIAGLQAGTAYSFLVRTFTPKHTGQTNDITSATSDAITAMPAPNQPPVAAGDSYTTSRDTALTVDAAHGLLANDSDPDGNPLTIGSIASVSPGSHLALNPDGSFTYTPAPGFVGTDTFTYRASDGQALSNPASVTFTVAAKPTVATITIVLDVQPDSKTNFSFAGGLGAFLLDDITPQDGDAYTSSRTFSVPAGTYTVTEQLPSGWSNANISCNPPANTIADLAKNQIAISAAAGANITCTFVTQRDGQLIAGAYNDHNHNHVRNSNDEWLRGWQMQLHSAQSGQVTTLTTDLEGRAVFTNLRPGAYTVCETLPAGWYNITPGSLDATFKQPCYSVTVAPGQAVWARFGNSTAPLLRIANVQTFSDVAICDLAPTDDAGDVVAPERDLWEEEEAASGTMLFLPLLAR